MQLGAASVLILMIAVTAFSAPVSAVARSDDGLVPLRQLGGAIPAGDGVIPIDGDFPDFRPIDTSRHGPIEVMIGLDGRSLAEEMERRSDLGLAPLSTSAQRQYIANLERSQAGLIGLLASRGATVTYRYHIVLNGVAAFVDPAVLPSIRSYPGVTRVGSPGILERALDNSVPFILGGQTYAELGSDGTGSTIAVIDTGIDYTHKSLGGSGVVADYKSNNPTVIEPGTFPTAKVIGGTDLVGEWYNANCPPVPPAPGVCSSIPMPDPDPLDLGGHGSHVSGIAAGVGSSGVPHGVAPGAKLLAVKVFALGSVSFAVVAAALEFAADPNQDGSTSDHADVVNMSLGSAFGRNTEFGALATNAAVAVGIIVVASAGNSGNLLYITGAPAAAEKAISVAAGNDPGIKVQLVRVAGSSGKDGDYESLEGAITVPLSTSGTKSGLTTFVGDACSPSSGGSLTGKIPLIARGTCTFQSKLVNVQAGGAIAAVVYNNVAGAGPIIMGGSSAGVTIPGVMTGNVDGLAIRAALTSGTTFTLDPSNQLVIKDRLQGFTSRGPRFGDSAIKPDITAPGGNILSVRVGSGTGGVQLSGTSMSSPHVAGAAAILRALHPRWSVAEIKAVLMNTATNASPDGVNPYPISLMGAGRVRVDVAAHTWSVVTPASASFRVVESDDTGWETFSLKLELRNKGTSTKSFSLASAFAFANDNEGSVVLNFPSSLKVGRGDSKSFELRLRVNFNALAPESAFEEYDGFLTLTEKGAGGDVLRVPFHVIPLARADAEVEDEDHDDGGAARSIEIENEGIRGTLVDIYQFGGKDPNEDLIQEVAGAPNDPDGWFDIRYFGAKAYDTPNLGRVVEFAVRTQSRRSVANLMLTEAYIDVNGGGADYLVQVADFGLFSPQPFFDGRMATAIFHLPSGAGVGQFFLVADDRNTAVQTFPMRLDSLNALAASRGGPRVDAADPDFTYTIRTVDLEEGAEDTTASASFNALVPDIWATPDRFTLAADASANVSVTVSKEGSSLLIIYPNNESGSDQSEVVDFEFGDDD